MIFLKKVYSKIYYIYNNFFTKMFMYLLKNCKLNDNYYIFQSEGDYADNAKALSEYVLSNMTNIKVFWIVNNPKLYTPKNNEFFLYFNSLNPLRIFKRVYYTSRSKYLFFTHPYWYKKINKSQVVVHLNHGTTFKKPNGNVGDSYDYLICTSNNVVPWAENFWGATRDKILIAGYGRNDYLFNVGEKAKSFLNKTNEKIIMCMPTYHQHKDRNDSDLINPFIISYINSYDELIKLNEYLKEKNIKIIVKPHHLQDMSVVNNIDCSNIVFITDEILSHNDVNLYEVVAQTDGLLTDLSSIYFDYLLIDKPIGFFANELEEYGKKRGYMFENYDRYMPGHFIYNYDDLIKYIDDISNNIDEHADFRKRINDFVNEYKENHCESILNALGIEVKGVKEDE